MSWSLSQLTLSERRCTPWTGYQPILGRTKIDHSHLQLATIQRSSRACFWHVWGSWSTMQFPQESLMVIFVKSVITTWQLFVINMVCEEVAISGPPWAIRKKPLQLRINNRSEKCKPYKFALLKAHFRCFLHRHSFTFSYAFHSYIPHHHHPPTHPIFTPFHYQYIIFRIASSGGSRAAVDDKSLSER